MGIGWGIIIGWITAGIIIYIFMDIKKIRFKVVFKDDRQEEKEEDYQPKL